MLHIRLFGQCSLSEDKRPIGAVSQPRAQSLLAFLLLKKGAVDRSQLAMLLWPRSSDAQARTNLRRELHLLKTANSAIESALRINRQTICWQNTPECNVDVFAFDAYAKGFYDSDDVTRKISYAKEIKLIHSAPLLASFHYDWVDIHRKRYLRDWVFSMEWLATECIESSQWNDASDIINCLMQADSLRESTQILLTRMLIKREQPIDAIRNYRKYASRLLIELDLQPCDELKNQYRSLTDRKDFRTDTNHILGDSQKGNIHSHEHLLNSHYDLAFIGRDAYIRRLHQLWKGSRDSADHKPRLILLEGEPGIGKTRLAVEFIKDIFPDFNLNDVGRCFPGEGNLAFTPLANWLKSKTLRNSAENLDDQAKYELHCLFPNIFRLPGTQSFNELKRSRSRLFEAMSQTFTRVDIPQIFVMDDIQWCDQDSLEWLHYLFKCSSISPLIIIATLRPEELAFNQQANMLVDRLEAAKQIDRLSVCPLDNIQAESLLQSELSRGNEYQVNNKLLHCINLRAEGNPLFLLEMTRDALAHGGNWDESTVLPNAVSAVIRQRISRISDDALLVFRSAAVIGKQFSLELLTLICDLEMDALTLALDILWQRKLINELTNNNFEFSHDCIRETVLEALSDTRRKFLHHRIAVAACQIHANSLDQASGLIAQHYNYAGLASEAITWFWRAAEISEQALAYRESIHSSAKALQQLDNLEKSASRTSQRVQFLVHQARITSLLYGLSADRVKELCVEIERILPEVDDLVLRQLAFSRLRTTASFSDTPEKAREYAFEEVHAAKRGKSWERRVEAYRSLSFTQYQLGHFRAAKKTIGQALNIGDTALKNGCFEVKKAPWTMVMSLFFNSHLLVKRGRFDAARTSLALGQEYRTNNACHNALAHVNLAHVIALQELGQHKNAQCVSSEFLRLADISGLHKTLCFYKVYSGWSRCGGSSSSEGIKSMQEGISDYMSLEEHHFLPLWYSMLGECLLQQNELEEANLTVQKGITSAQHARQVFSTAELYRLQAMIMDGMGESTLEVQRQFDASSTLARRQGAKLFLLRSLTHQLEHAKRNNIDTTLLYQQLFSLYKQLKSYGKSIDLDNAQKILT